MTQLSFAQQRLWFLYQLEGPSPTYNIPVALRLSGTVEATALGAAFVDLCARHESLRTILTLRDGKGEQRVLDPDASGRSLECVSIDPDELDAAIDEAVAYPFRLDEETPIRAWLFAVAPDDHVLLFVIHHVAADGASLGPLTADLATAYASRLDGRAPVWDPLPVQYADYALWQRELLGDEADDTSLIADRIGYWLRQLADMPERTAIAGDRARPTRPSGKGGVVSFAFDAATHDSLLVIGRRCRATLSMVMHAAVAVLVTMLGGGDDVVLGTPVDGRDDEALEDLVGFFVNSLVLRLSTGGNPSFATLVERAREIDLAAYVHQEIPFDRLVEALHVPRTQNAHPLFQIKLMVQTDTGVAVALRGLDVEPYHVEIRTARCDLGFNFVERLDAGRASQGIRANLEYSADLYDVATVERIARHFSRLIDAVVADPDRRLSELDMLSSDERSELLRWGDGGQPQSAEDLATLFERRARATPDAVAAVFEDVELSYAALDDRANWLAHHLVSLGVSRDVFVGLYLERSLDVVVAILAVAKAGGVYVPLDPTYPDDRVSYMLSDAMPAAVITTTDLAGRLPATWAQIVEIDAEAHEAKYGAAQPPVRSIYPADLLYLIYTSGSTGRPKGVGVTHAGVASLAATLVARLQAGPGARILQFASLSFDAAFWELSMALLSGGTLVLAPKARIAPGDDLAALVAGQGITHLTLPPTALAAMPKDGLPKGCHLVLAGESPSPDLLRRWVGGRTLVNAYGPTETTVCASMSDPLAPISTVPIGRPLVGSRIYVLDARMRLAAPGVTGHLYVAGPSLARGYLNRFGLTAERFVANPFEAGTRMYRTGDLAHWSRDGLLIFDGRDDDQIKLRGFRIETGEIEAVLTAMQDVAQAAVVVREDRPDQQQLVAYVEPARGRAVDSGTIRGILAEKLPNYMVPALVEVIDVLPTSLNGKIDRAALPAPKVPKNAAAEAPVTALEQKLCTLFADVMGIDQVGAGAGFFDLGGDSLIAIRLKAEAHKRGMTFELIDLFSHQSPRALADHVREAEGDAVERIAPFSLVELSDRDHLPADAEDAYPLSQLQLAMLFHGSRNRERVLYHNAFSIELTMPFVPDALREALDGIGRRHEMLRTSFDLGSYSEPLQIVHSHAKVPLRLIDLRNKPSTRHEQIIAGAVRRLVRKPFDETVAPLLEIYGFRMATERFRLILCVHHAIMDGWSDALFVTELVRRYTGLLKGSWREPPAVGVQVCDYIRLEREAMRSDADRAFWRERMTGYRPAEPIRAYRDDGKEAATGVHSIDLRIDATVAARLSQIGSERGTSLKIVLLAAHMAALSMIVGSPEVVSALVTNGRPEVEDGEGLIGLFLNSVPFVARIDGMHWGDLVAEIARREAEILPHRRYPLAAILREADMPTPPGVLFNYTHFHAYEKLGETAEAVRAGGVAGENSFGLVAGFRHEDGALRGSLTGSVVYARTDLERYAACYDYVLRAVADRTDSPIRRIGLLEPRERQTMLGAWNDTSRSVSSETLHGAVERFARSTPDAPAIRVGGQSWSFAQLDQAATRIAAELAKRNIGSGAAVAIAMPKSMPLFAAMLGIGKVGAAFLPLDLSYPDARLTFMMEDAGAACVLSVGDSGAGLSSRDVFDVASWIKQPAASNFVRPPQPSGAPAYVIYTSGSTGTPKGVLVTTAGLGSLAASLRDRCDITAADRVLQFASPGFDACVLECLLAFSNGAALVVAVEEDRAADALARFIEAEGITNALLPPALLPVMPTHELRNLRTLLIGGEACPAETVARWAPGRRMINAYGPTEATVCATMAFCDADGRAPTIGRPLVNARIYLLDDGLQPVLIGVAGEIYISGAGLAMGYVGKSALTAARFVANPFSEAGERLYRTGDRACWRADGELEFLGRNDRQVQLRGVRIELGEIEAALLSQRQIVAAVAMVRENANGESMLVAYIVGRGSVSLDERQVRATLSTHLPQHLVPSVITLLPELPLTANGKVDVTALPVPAFVGSRRIPPRTLDETAIAALFIEVLGIDEIGVEDNFFDLGGDSLSAVRLARRATVVLSRPIPVGFLYEHPTVRELAWGLMERESESQRQRVVPLQSGGDGVPIFCVPPAASDAWCYKPLALRIAKRHPVYGLQNDLDVAASVDDIVQRNIDSIRTLNPVGPYALVGWSVGGLMAHAIARGLQADGQAVSLLALLDAYPPSALPTGIARDEGAGQAATIGRIFDRFDVPDDLEPPEGLDTREMSNYLLAEKAITEIEHEEVASMLASLQTSQRHAHEIRLGLFEGDMLFLGSNELGTRTVATARAAWEPHVTGSVRIEVLPANHLDMLDARTIGRVAKLINDAAARS